MSPKFFIRVFFLTGVILTAYFSSANAYETYSSDRSTGNCASCHGNFRASPYTSLADGVDWNDGLHNVHRNTMLNGDCSACHASGGRFPVFLDSSSGSNGFDISCIGCHGRQESGAGGQVNGAGLRQHHWNSGVESCSDCHDDSDPDLFTTVGEDVLPPYYFTPDTSHPNKPTDPCNPGGEEDFAGTTIGLDNNGDGLLYDLNDPSCQAANQSPVAVDDSYTTDEDTPLNVAVPGVLTNDTDADSDPLDAFLNTGVSNGALTLNADGSFSYAPNADFFGTDIFTYVANDSMDDSNIATVTITVNAVNDPPVSDPNGSYIGTVGSDVSFDGSGSSDMDGNIVSYDWDFGDGNTGTGVNPTQVYTVPGVFTVTLTVTDDGGATDTATTTADIIDVPNSPPIAVDDAYTTNEDTALNVAAPGVLANDTDADGDTLNTLLTADASNGTLVLNSDGSFTYTPNSNFFGTDTFTYVASDGMDDSNISTVTITVNAVNDPPMSDPNGSYIGTVGSNVSFDGSGSSDIDGIIASYAWDFGDGNTGTGVNPTNAYTGSGLFTVTLTVTDDGGATDTATTTADINDVPNTPPAATDDSYTTNEDTALNVAAPGVLANDTDADGDTLTVRMVTDVSNGTLILNSDGSFNYMPNVNFSGSDTFTYMTSDGLADSNIATVSLTVNAVNDQPMAVDNNYTTPEDTMFTVTAPGVLGNDSDPEGDTLTANQSSNVANGTLSLNADGSFAYTPSTGFTGSDSFTYVANDGALDSNVATVSITVQAGANKPPVAVDDTATTPEETTVTIDVLANDSDPDGDPLMVMAVSVPVNGTAVNNGDGTVTYTPNNNFTGTDLFTYTVQDGQGGSSTATVTVEVTPVNDQPVANDDAYNTSQDTMLTVAAPGVLGNDSDPDGDTLTAHLVNNVANGFLLLNEDGSFDYTPDPGFTGSDTFTYVANDGLVDSTESTVTIMVQAIEVCDDESLPVITEMEYNRGDEKLHLHGRAAVGTTISVINSDTGEILAEGIRVKGDRGSWEAEIKDVGNDLMSISVISSNGCAIVQEVESDREEHDDDERDDRRWRTRR